MSTAQVKPDPEYKKNNLVETFLLQKKIPELKCNN